MASANFDGADQEELERNRKAVVAENAQPDELEMAQLMLANDIRARYKIEITFGKDRTIQGPNHTLVKIYESGKFFHGGGDDMMYWCKDVGVEASWADSPGCGRAIPSNCIHNGIALCPHCSAMINAERLTSERGFRLTTQVFAGVIDKIFRELGMNADIYCKYHRADIRYLACERTYGEEKARALRGMFIYPLANLLKDTAAGADRVGRIRAFLSA